MIKQNNNKKSYLFIFTILTMCILSVFALTYNSLLCTNVFAEETNADPLTNSSVLDFNQLINITNTVSGSGISTQIVNNGLSIKYTGTATDTQYNYQISNTFQLVTGHKYYYNNFADLQTANMYFRVGTAANAVLYTKNAKGIFTSNVNLDSKVAYIFHSGVTYNITVTPQLIDLTQMFGAGNEPTIEDINNYNIFPTYYSYTASKPIIYPKDNLTAYQNGYNAALNDYLNSIETITSFSNSYANLTYAQVGGYTGSGMTRGVDIIDNKEHYAVFYDADTLALAPFIIQNNTKATIKFEYFEPVNAPQSSDYPVIFEMYAVNGNDLFKVWEYRASNWTQATSIKEIEFIAPFTMNGLYISVSERFSIVNMTAIYTTNDLGLLVQNSNESGYNAGYLQGKKDGEIVGRENALATGKVWQNGWDFISSTFTSIGNIFDIKIFGDIPLWTFIAIPLLFGLIIFLFRISGGN